eukprot:TRINITY_DN5143_c1_g1_i1.p2 TRINITY_DN5143_c1_g1~~TRINITY_DN5143_c1_g1_i1.p2  ORF type:complete len:53 (+),score=8.18 TRINITY_DN5143_c1_g1_i1:242-400(+)
MYYFFVISFWFYSTHVGLVALMQKMWIQKLFVCKTSTTNAKKAKTCDKREKY